MNTKTKIILIIAISVVGTTFIPAACTFIYWASGGNFKPGHDFGMYAASMIFFELVGWIVCGMLSAMLWDSL